jgi:hypothetical protein
VPGKLSKVTRSVDSMLVFAETVPKPGWDEGIAGMAVNGERKLTIPSNMGFVVLLRICK